MRLSRSAVRRPMGGGQETTGPIVKAQVATPTIRVPDSLAELDQWVPWKYEQRDGGKPTKVPFQVNGSHASSTDSSTWCSCEKALTAWKKASADGGSSPGTPSKTGSARAGCRLDFN